MKCSGHPVLLLMGVSFIVNVNSWKVGGYFKCKEPTNAEDLATVTGEYLTGTGSVNATGSESSSIEEISRRRSNFSNCQDVLNAGHTTTGIYTISPSNWNRSPFQVYCNMSEDGGWTVFQRRVDGSVDFDRNWTSYKEGFGELHHEFWLGNEKLYYLTNQGNCTLRIDLVGSRGNPHYAEYDLFRINDESDNYRLSRLGTFNGTLDDALTDHLSDIFSTLDRDDDYRNGYDCAEAHHGAWWCEGCCHSNLNGNYHSAGRPSSSIFWEGQDKSWHYIKYTEMQIKPN